MKKNHNKIEEMKSHLYNPDDPNSGHYKEGTLHRVKYKVPKEWQKEVSDKETNLSAQAGEEYKKPKTSIFKKFFIGAIIFFIGAISFAAYNFFTGGVSVSNDNIDIAVLGNAFTKGDIFIIFFQNWSTIIETIKGTSEFSQVGSYMMRLK